MASGRITVAVGLETGDVKKGAKDAEKSLEHLEDAVKDAGKGAKDLDKIEDELKDVQKQSKKTGDDVGRNLDDGFRKAGDGANDFKEEANSSAREAAASFDGSAESIGDLFQEVAANAFAGFGPAGAVAGLAAAAGIGLAVAGFEAVTAAQELSAENVAAWADAYVESGGTVLSASTQIARALEFITDPEAFKTAESNAKTWGVSIETAIGAMSGNTGALQDVRNAVREQGTAFEDAKDKAGAMIDEYGNLNGPLVAQEQALRNSTGALGKLTGEMDAGKTRARILNGFYEDLINSTKGVTVEVDELGNELYSLPDGTQVVVDAETGQASADVSTFKGDLDKAVKPVTAKINLDDSAIRNYRPPPITLNATIRTGGRQVV